MRNTLLRPLTSEKSCVHMCSGYSLALGDFTGWRTRRKLRRSRVGLPSSNSFVQLPSCLTELPQLKSLNASKNFVAEVEIEAVLASSLDILNLEENPLSKSCYEEMCRQSKVRVVLSPREQEDWEDLSI